MSSRYQDLARKAWESGEYKARPGDEKKRGEGGDGMRPFLRSKMEWIVEREGYDFKGPEKAREGAMKLAQHVKFREEKFGGVLFETRSEKVYTLSPTGAAVVREILKGGDENEVLQRLRESYEDPDGKLKAEAEGFIAELRKNKLIE